MATTNGLWVVAVSRHGDDDALSTYGIHDHASAVFGGYALIESAMSRSSRLIDQPTELFSSTTRPEIEPRFRCLQVAGNEEARELANMAAEINGSIWRLWSAVENAEDLERDRAAAAS